MDLEIMSVQVNEEDYRQKDYIMSRFYRSMLRKGDDKGKVKRMHMEL